MKFLVYILILTLFWSCKQSNFKKVDAEDIAQKELKTINFKEVDRFPLFKTCDETASREVQQSCFEQHLHLWLKPYLDALDVELLENDTLHLFLKINKTGKIQLDLLNSKMDLNKTFQRIFEKAPQIYPAQKRGIPVNVKFELPIILKVN
ncbi:hypothetical protein [Flavobacterium sp. CS20]|uniref:hypothetical protein n=1 Tax=Flavobacterium sp. CS20 TaxID=2775246 RepID=UPI001B3A6FF7|nr:hypothetical protein [Flavobacterium sp. CS20]QTY26053.1 hypothetical protein IGB25_08595 [Flavobacterium sp. CS20]